MASNLVDAMRKLQMSVSEDQDVIDDQLFQLRPRKRFKVSDEELKRQLEDEFLKPSNSLSIEWLNRLQRSAYLILGGLRLFTSFLGDGTPQSIMPTSFRWPRPKRERLRDSPVKALREE